MNKEHQELTDSFEVLVHELHELTNKMIVADGLDMHVKARAAKLNSWLELNLPEYFRRKK